MTDVTIIADQVGGVFTPSELEPPTVTTGELGTGAGDTIVTGDGDFISLVDYDQPSDPFLALMAEILPETLEVYDGITTETLL